MKNGLFYHPGEVLKEVYMKDLNLNVVELSLICNSSSEEIEAIVNGQKDITPQMALLLGRALNTGGEIWISMQQEYDLRNGETNPQASCYID